MPKKRQDEMQRILELALAPGTFIGYRDQADFIATLEAVRAKITALIRQEGESTRAVALLEIFVAACYEKAEEIDDSGGDFGEFVGELFCDWIRARQATKADPEETVRSLHSWMENDSYGFCTSLDEKAVSVLDRGGLRILERISREKANGSEKKSYAHTQSVEVLKAIHVKKGEATAYAELCQAEDDLAPADCEKLAEMSLKKGRIEDALTWVERGLELEKKTSPSRFAWRLPDLQREILKRLGRHEDALASAWDAYRRAPSVYSYDDLMKFVPRIDRRDWHGKALAVLDDADLSCRIELLIKMKERNLLAAAIESASRDELIALSHYTTEPATRALTKTHPLLAAKLEIAIALRILVAKKSKYYAAALRNLEHARKLMLENERASEWETLAEELHARHRRKTSFIAAFQNLTRGHSTRRPSFADRARDRWESGARGGRRK